MEYMEKFEKMLDRLKTKRDRLNEEIEALELLQKAWSAIGPYGIDDQQELDAVRREMQHLFDFDDSE